jgi:hypothetical protein
MSHKLFKVDITLITATLLGMLYLYYTQQVSIMLGITIVLIYIMAKIVGYMILPYPQFETFLNALSEKSTLTYLSGYEIFKTSLVVLLFIGYIFIDPTIWILESILVVMMRVWGYDYIESIKS